MCSHCAVKLHEKEHRVDEYNKLVEKGILNFFLEQDEPVDSEFFVASTALSDIGSEEDEDDVEK